MNVTGEDSLKQQIQLSTSTDESEKLSQLVDAEEQREDLKNLLTKIYIKEKEYHDESDVDLQPSFSKFQVPYFIKCRNRYNERKKIIEERFQYEIEQLIAHQSTGYEAANLHRHLCITSIWPPLHNVSEINHTQRHFFSLSRKARSRLNAIMNSAIILN